MRVKIDLSTKHSNRIEIDWSSMSRSEFDYAVSEVKSLGAKFVGRDKGGPYWHLPLEISACYALRESFGKSLVVSKRLAQWARDDLKRKSDVSEIMKAGDATLDRLPQDHPEMAEYLRDYQRACVRFMEMAEHGVLIADQPGLGKTVEALAGIIESGRLKGDHLIIAPKSSLNTVWAREIAKWMPGDVFVYGGKKKEKAAVVEAFEDSIEDTRWFIINPESARGKFVRDPDGRIDARTGDVKQVLKTSKLPFLYETEWETITIDECHKGAVRNPKTVTAISLRELKTSKTGLKIALSGTPMKNKAIDLWGVLHWLDPDKWSSKWSFASMYCEIEDNGYGKIIRGIRGDMEEVLWRDISTVMIRRRKSEVAKELPEKLYIDEWCELTDTQRRQYDEMQKNAEVRLSETSNITTTNILTELLRLKQFAIARFIDTGENDKPFGPSTDSGKLIRLLELLDEREMFEDESDPAEEEKAVVFSQFSQVMDMVARELSSAGARVAMITGGFSGFIDQNGTRIVASREEVQDAFQADGGPNILCMTTTAGGVSITLDRADTVFFMDETWSPADMEQAEDRIHRISRIHQVIIYKLRSLRTVDEDIMNIVRDKDSQAYRALDHYRKKSTETV